MVCISPDLVQSISESCEINHSNYTYNYWMSIPSEDNFKNYEKYPSWNSVVQNDCLIQLLWKFIPNVPILAENIFFLLKVTTKVSKILPTSDKLMCEMGFSSFWFILQSTSFLLWGEWKKSDSINKTEIKTKQSIFHSIMTLVRSLKRN